MALQQIDIDAPQPNGRVGESARSAHIKVNANTTEIGLRLEALEEGTGGAGQAIEELRSELQQETQERQQAVQQESAARSLAVEALQQADDTLGERIDAEQIARQQQAEALGFRIIGKNRLINANFDINQRANSGNIVNSAVYTSDRWICSCAGAGVTSNWGMGPATVGEIPGVRRYLGFNVVAGATSAWVGQRIEGVDTFAGRKATVSFWMRSSVAGKKVGVLAQQVFGTGGSAIVQVDGPVFTLTTTFQKYTATFDIPSISGKTVDANDNLLLAFFYSDNRTTLFGGQLSGQSGLFEIAQVQFEDGGKATAFEFRLLAYEMAWCQRYFDISYNQGRYPGAAT